MVPTTLCTENPSKELCGKLCLQAAQTEDCQDEVMCMEYLLAFRSFNERFYLSFGSTSSSHVRPSRSTTPRKLSDTSCITSSSIQVFAYRYHIGCLSDFSFEIVQNKGTQGLDTLGGAEIKTPFLPSQLPWPLVSMP